MSDKEEIKRLKKRIAILEDENESLWHMLDEMHKSDPNNWLHLVKKLKDDVLARALLASKKRVDAQVH